MDSVDGKANPRKHLDLSKIRKPSDITSHTETVEPLLQVKVGRPGRHDFIYVRDDKDFQTDAMLYADKSAGGAPRYYLVGEALGGSLDEELKPVTLYLIQIRFGPIQLWPVPFPDADATRRNPWIESQREAAERGKGKWIRIYSDMKAGHYKVVEAEEGAIPDPVWPDCSFAEIVDVAFQKFLISDRDHQIVKNLLGKA